MKRKRSEASVMLPPEDSEQGGRAPTGTEDGDDGGREARALRGIINQSLQTQSSCISPPPCVSSQHVLCADSVLALAHGYSRLQARSFNLHVCSVSSALRSLQVASSAQARSGEEDAGEEPSGDTGGAYAAEGEEAVDGEEEEEEGAEEDAMEGVEVRKKRGNFD